MRVYFLTLTRELTSCDNSDSICNAVKSSKFHEAKSFLHFLVSWGKCTIKYRFEKKEASTMLSITCHSWENIKKVVTRVPFCKWFFSIHWPLTIVFIKNGATLEYIDQKLCLFSEANVSCSLPSSEAKVHFSYESKQRSIRLRNRSISYFS